MLAHMDMQPNDGLFPSLMSLGVSLCPLNPYASELIPLASDRCTLVRSMSAIPIKEAWTGCPWSRGTSMCEQFISRLLPPPSLLL